jgi:hypothetical protein
MIIAIPTERVYPSLNRAPFWRFFRGIDSPVAAKLWANIFKTAGPKQGGHSLLHYSSNIQRRVLKWQEGLLRDEIRAFEPTHLLFVTGPQYDSFIRECLGDFITQPLPGKISQLRRPLLF